MTTGVLEDQIKMRLLVGVIEEGEHGAEQKDAKGSGKTDCSDHEAFAGMCGRNPVCGHRIGTH